MATLTVEMGNFSPNLQGQGIPAKQLAMTEFFKREHYDAVTLSSFETMHGITPWLNAADEGLPVVIANLYHDKRGGRTVFEPYLIKEDHGVRMAVVGLMSYKAFRLLGADTAAVHFKSPYELQKLMKKVDKKSDHITLMGDFTKPEADSLAKVYPKVDVILAAGLNTNQPVQSGNAVITGSPARGYYGDYVDWNFTATDSAKFHSGHVTLDDKMREDEATKTSLNKAGLSK